jgi:tRNA-modifying protein YgfZ
MAARCFARLEGRALLRLAGADARPFLQNLVSNDLDRLTPERAIYAALLTPQGKYLFDFFVLEAGEALLLDCEARRLGELAKRLAMYRLRAKVEIAADETLAVCVGFGDGAAPALELAAEPGAARPFAGGIAFVDPRLAAAGIRAVAPADAAMTALAEAGFAPGDAAAYDRHRLRLALPDSSRDLEVDRTVLLEANFEELHGVDFHKGCFVGQEVTARTKYRGLVKKRLVRVDVDGPLPPADTAIRLGDKEVGQVRSGTDGLALALLRLEALDEAIASGTPLTAGSARLTPVRPAWEAGEAAP